MKVNIYKFILRLICKCEIVHFVMRFTEINYEQVFIALFAFHLQIRRLFEVMIDLIGHHGAAGLLWN